MENLEKKALENDNACEKTKDSGLMPGKSLEVATDAKYKGKARQKNIWTDIYKPKSFTELLGDEVRFYFSE